MKVKEIILKYLKDNGYEGLVNEDAECGCELEDLMCCDNSCENCEPGYKHKCPEGHEFDWIIAASKDKPDFSNEDQPNTSQQEGEMMPQDKRLEALSTRKE
jgi:hypothetical protein